MAILQISRIQTRRGLKEDLPTLSSAELGWAIDTRELYIGNGNVSLSPLPGQNTRILTERDLTTLRPNLGSVTLLAGQTSNIAVIINPTNSTLTSTTVIITDVTATSTIVNYSISRELTANIVDYRTGTLSMATNGSTISYSDDYVETADVGITLTPNVTVIPGSISIQYSSTTGNTALLTTAGIILT